MREYFLLDPEFAFLNHGSFGACPKPVFDVYQNWQLELERQPVRFYQRIANDALDEARVIVGEYLNAPAQDIHFVRNATVGINYIARSIDLQPGDEVLTTDHEYGAMDATWTYVCEQAGAAYEKVSILLPYTTDEAFLETLWAGVTDRTKVIFLSHITSPTALTFPIAQVCQRARAAGILTVVDGAHVPGQRPLDLTAIDPDYYTGNFHKWLCAPKSAAFMYARREHQAHWYPLIVSWGMLREETPTGRLQWKGTDDVAAYLTVPAAIEFQQTHDWTTVRAQCHALALAGRQRLMDLFGKPAASPPENFVQLFIAELPACDPVAVQDRLHHEFKVEVPLTEWGGRQFVRVSVQGYNTADDFDRLIDGLAHIFDC